MKTIILSSHYSGTPGSPTDKFFDYLKTKYKVIVIRHPLFLKSKIQSEIILPSSTIKFNIHPSLQHLVEGIITFFAYNKSYKKRPEISLAICFDALAFFQLYIFKKLYKIKKIVFYNVDFSKQRFPNPILNQIYLWLNVFSFQKADYVFSLYQTFLNDMDPMSKLQNKSSVVKSTVWLKQIKSSQIRIPNSIVYAGGLGYSSNNFLPLFQALKKLHEANVNFTFDIYGPNPDETILPKKISALGLNKIVTFKGSVDNKVLTEKILPQYKIAVAPYVTRKGKNTPDHTFSGDDLTAKIVDYLAAGLPVITTEINSGFQQLSAHNCGFLARTATDWERHLKTLLKNRKLYLRYSHAARLFAKQYDITTILKPILTKILA